MIPSGALGDSRTRVLLAVGEVRRGPLVECYRSGVKGRFTCLDRWPSLPRKWCCGCGRMARVADRLAR